MGLDPFAGRDGVRSSHAHLVSMEPGLSCHVLWVKARKKERCNLASSCALLVCDRERKSTWPF